jgi:hypothetical protein
MQSKTPHWLMDLLVDLIQHPADTSAMKSHKAQAVPK